MNAFHDMHCHLDFMANAAEVAGDARADGALLFANTVTPDGWIAAQAMFAEFGNVATGFGMHPWWVTDNEPSRGALQEALDRGNPQFIGEVGLDFGKKHAETREAQLEAFDEIARWAGERGGRVLSIHSVGAAREVLDVLSPAGALENCACIFHWYSGPSDQLKRAIDAGCYFSINERMLATRRGPEYVKAIPTAQLLLETDAPPGQGVTYSHAALQDELARVAKAVTAIKGNEALSQIEQTSMKLLSLETPG